MNTTLRHTAACLLAGMLGLSHATRAEKLEVFTWEPMAGKGQTLVQGMMAAAKIHNATGATVGIYQHDVGSTQ